MSKHPYREMISDLVDAAVFAVLGTLAFLFAFTTVISLLTVAIWLIWSVLA